MRTKGRAGTESLYWPWALPIASAHQHQHQRITHQSEAKAPRHPGSLNLPRGPGLRTWCGGVVVAVKWLIKVPESLFWQVLASLAVRGRSPGSPEGQDMVPRSVVPYKTRTMRSRTRHFCQLGIPRAGPAFV